MPSIIGGKFKRTKIEIPNKFVRPTSALKREAIFSILESYALQNSTDIYTNKSIIDVFAGSGLIGLEAISRGMKKSYFIENNASVLKVLKKNCEKICKNNEYEIIAETAIEGIDRVFEIQPSLIYVDPPYRKEDINSFLSKILKLKIKSKNTVIIVETNQKDDFVIPNNLIKIKEKIYGKTKLLFLN